MPQLTPQENFRLGFLMRCAEEGCSMEEVRERVKFASESWIADQIGRAVAPAWNVAKTMASIPLHATLLGFGGAAALGAAGGYGLAKFQNSDVDPEEAKRQELISAYQLQADLARRRAQQRSYRRNAPASPNLFKEP